MEKSFWELIEHLERRRTPSLRKRRRWYAEGEVAGQQPAQQQQPPAKPTTNPVDTATAKPDNAGAEVEADEPQNFSREYVKDLRKEAASWRTKYRGLEERLETLEKERKDEEEAELREQNLHKELADKYKAELEQTKAQVAAERLNTLRLSVAARFGQRLPRPSDPNVDPVTEFAKRLQGSNEDELREDAERLIAIFGLAPGQQQSAQQQQTAQTSQQQQSGQAQGQQAGSQQTTTAVPGGQPVGRTDADRKREYFTGVKDSPIFQKGTLTLKISEPQ